MKYLRYSDIRRQQNEVSAYTRDRLPGFFRAFEEGIDALLTLQQNYPAGNSVPVTPDERFRSSATLWFFSSIFSFSSSVALVENGYYAESVIVNRTITEILIQLRYFSILPEEMIKLPSLSGNRRRLVQLKTMYERIAPGFYDIWYKFSSEFAHAGVGAHIFKITRDPVSGVAVGDPGVVFKEDWCGACFNEVLMLLLGFIRAYGVAFPDARTSLPSLILTEWKRIENVLEDFVNQHIALKGGANEWHSLSRPLWKPS
jgi:hypothetical protein